MKHLGERYNDKNTHRLTWALIVWVLLGALTFIYLEYNKRLWQETVTRSS
ncbi:hypothetical protein HanHA89_Chr01g0027441 [Helianthus annuus]|nr:hypothetical protein HanHA89_Chr01g0027441 [Helianthus annuus]